MRIFKGLASVCVDHGVGVVCTAVLSSDEVLSGSRYDDGCIDRGCFGHWEIVWKELHCLGGALSSGLGNIETVAAIVFWGSP